MNKTLRILLWGGVVLSSLLAAGCAKEYDDTELRGKISDLDGRLTIVEQAVKTLNEQTIPGINALIQALQQKLTVTAVTTNQDGSHTIAFSDGTSVVIKDGDKGASPVISATEVDGIYYWTINGEVLEDGDGNPLPVHGKDAVTPIFRVNSDGFEYSVDGGETWVPVPVAEDSVPFVEFEETDDSVVFTFADGTSFTLAKVLDFSLFFTIPQELSLLTSETGYVGYTLSGVDDGDVTEVDVLVAPDGFEVVVEPYEGQNDAGVISITNNSENANSEHKVYIFASNGKGKTDIKGLKFSSATVKAVWNVSVVNSDGGTQTLNVKANEDYTVSVSEEAKEWLSVTDPVRAIYNDGLTVTIAANETNAYRAGTITLTSKESGEVLDEVDVLQGPSSADVTDLSSVEALPDGTKVTVYKVSAIAATASKAIVTDGTKCIVVQKEGLYAEGVFDITGKKYTDDEGFAYIADVTAISILDQIPVKFENHDYFVWYLAAENDYTFFYTAINGELKKDGTTYYVVDDKGYSSVYVAVTDAPEELGLESLVGETVALKGWVPYAKSQEKDILLELYPTAVAATPIEVQPAWTLSYEEKDGVDVIGIEAPETDYFSLIYISEDELLNNFESVDDFINQYPYNASSNLWNIYSYVQAGMGWLIGYNYDSFDQMYSDLVINGDYSFNPELGFGKFYVYAAGLDEDGAYTGQYAIQEFEKVSPYAFNTYEGYLGDYTFTNAYGLEEVWTLAQDVAGETYTVSGIGGVTAENIPGGKLAVAEFSPLTGLVSISNQLLGSWSDEDGSYTDKLVAVWFSGAAYSNEKYMDDPLILSFGLNQSGSVDLFIEQDYYGQLEGFAYLYNIEGTSQFGSTGTPVKFKDAKLVPGVVESNVQYSDYLGEWSQGISTVWSIEEKVAGETYSITGLLGQGTLPALEGVFENGKLVVSEGDLGENQYLSGIFEYWGTYYLNYPGNGGPDILFTAKLNEEGDIDLIPGDCSYGEFVAFTFVDAQVQSAYTYLPLTLTPYDPNVVVNPLQYSYSSSDFINGVSMDKLTGTAWDIYAIPGNGTEWFTEAREYLGPATVTDIDDNGTEDDLVTISGLSYVYGEIYGFDDSVLFDLYDGYLYSHPSSNGSFVYDETTLYVATLNVDSDYNDYPYLYTTVGGYVGEGIVALVSNSNSYDIDGFLFAAYADEDCKDFYSNIWAERSILLVDPEVYPTPEEQEVAANIGLNKLSKSVNASRKSVSCKRSINSRSLSAGKVPASLRFKNNVTRGAAPASVKAQKSNRAFAPMAERFTKLQK